MPNSHFSSSIIGKALVPGKGGTKHIGAVCFRCPISAVIGAPITATIGYRVRTQAAGSLDPLFYVSANADTAPIVQGGRNKSAPP